jgi:hypothetical protein
LLENWQAQHYVLLQIRRKKSCYISLQNEIYLSCVFQQNKNLFFI